MGVSFLNLCSGPLPLIKLLVVVYFTLACTFIKDYNIRDKTVNVFIVGISV